MAGEQEAPSETAHSSDGEPKRDPPQSQAANPSKMQQFLQKTGLTMPKSLLMIKAAVPPTIALSMYQSNVIATDYNTLGYLVAIASVLAFTIFPRAKFLQTLFLNVLGICVGAAVALLQTWSAVQARIHTTPPGHPLTGYNSSASAVCGVWLFFQIFLVVSIFSKLPQTKFPVILYTIFADISSTYGVEFPSTTAAVNFVYTLLKAFLTGFAIAAATHFVVFPVNARKPVWADMTGILGAMRGVLKAQISYMRAIEDEHLVRQQTANGSGEGQHTDAQRPNGSAKAFKHVIPEPKLDALKAQEEGIKKAGSGLHALMAKLQADLPFAKREVAYGKFGSEDISSVTDKLRNCALPLLGLGSLIDLMRRAAHAGGWEDMLISGRNTFEDLPGHEKLVREQGLEEWQAVMRTMHEPFANIADATESAIDHVMLTLEFKPRPKQAKRSSSRKADLEGQGDGTAPGEAGFASVFEGKVNAFYDSRQMTLQTWCAQRGLDLSSDSFDAATAEQNLFNVASESGQRHKGQIYVILYMEYLLYAASRAILELVLYADGKVSDGTMKKSRLVAPGGKRLMKWFKDALSKPEAADGAEQEIPGFQQESFIIAYGEGYSKHDPEHLPPTNAWEKFGNYVRLIPRTLRSPHCAHGLRAACATMSIGIIVFLKDTQAFFIQERLFWAMIMVAFSMQRTSGQSVFSFVMRVAATAIGMTASYVIWYIVNGHTAGVLVFEFLWITSCYWILFNKPRYAILAVLGAITSVIIIGYELQVQQIGAMASQSNGQTVHPLYLLAPIRLASVAGGLFVAWIWTIFPYPVSEHTELRRDVAATMQLLARYYTIVHETVKVRGGNLEGDLSIKTSPGRILDKARHSTFMKSQILISQLREVASFSPWQFEFGGRFPVETYTEMADRLERIMRCMSLIGYASTSFRDTHKGANDSNAEWLNNFTRLVQQVDPTSHAISARLSVLSASLANGSPLPPYMPQIEAFHLAKRIYEMDKDILSVRHLAEPGYAAFAVLQIASRTLVDELNALKENVRDLCGEMDFRVNIADPKV